MKPSSTALSHSPSSEIDLETHRKRLLMRAEHRGIKEMDIILGGYVRDNLASFEPGKMDELERFMEINDQKLYQMILGNEIVPEEFLLIVEDIRKHIGFDAQTRD